MRLFAEHTRHVGGIDVIRGESRIDDRADIPPVAVKAIGDQQHDDGAEFVAVHGHIHAPFVHGRVPDHIRGPGVAQQVGILRLLRPRLPDVAEHGVWVAAQIVLETFPMHHVGAARTAAMRAEDVVDAVIFDNCRIVDGDAAVGQWHVDFVGFGQRRGVAIHIGENRFLPQIISGSPKCTRCCRLR